MSLTENDLIPIFIVDDDPLVRDTVGHMLALAGFATNEFSNGQRFLEELPAYQYGCVLIDVNMPGMSGFDLQEKLLQLNVPFSVIIMSGNGEIPQAERAKRSGALDFLQKPFKRQQLIDHVKAGLLAAQEQYRRTQALRASELRFQKLSKREMVVARALAEGLSDKELANTLGLSTRTVEHHRTQIMQKLDLDNIAELIRLMSRIT